MKKITSILFLAIFSLNTFSLSPFTQDQFVKHHASLDKDKPKTTKITQKIAVMTPK
jgi:hypothetical protein